MTAFGPYQRSLADGLAARGRSPSCPDQIAAATDAAGRRVAAFSPSAEVLLPEPLDVLAPVVSFARRFVSFANEHQAVALALWVLHTHALDAATVTPYLAVTAPERQSGKTRVLEVLEMLVARPWKVTGPSEAVLFRKIARDCPTLLLDETDAIFKDKANAHEGVRALLNAGNRRGTSVPRCVGQGTAIDIKDFPVFCPKALAGIGQLPDTVADRSIPIRLKRRASGETVEGLYPDDENERAARIRAGLGLWVSHNLDSLRQLRPRVNGVNDRAAEGWQPLLAIAEVLGGTWPQRARDAALALNAYSQSENESLGSRLLGDIREVFGDRNRMKSADLAAELSAIETSPWGDYRGRSLDGRGLARLLRPYDVSPLKIRFPDGTFQGYDRSGFADAWTRYVLNLGDGRNNGTPQVGA